MTEWCDIDRQPTLIYNASPLTCCREIITRALYDEVSPVADPRKRRRLDLAAVFLTSIFFAERSRHCAGLSLELQPRA